MKVDNRGLLDKLKLRRAAMDALGVSPLVIETHGGRGVIGSRIYPRGVVFEKDKKKASTLARDRPHWRVYETCSVAALSRGVAADLPVSLLDVDPYGDPWPAVSAFFGFPRERAPRLVVAVNDGLRKAMKIGSGWRFGSLREAVGHFGSDLYPRYLEVARWMIERAGRRAGYRMEEFRGFYAREMTHYFGVFVADAAIVTDYLTEPLRVGRLSAAARGYDAEWKRTRLEHLEIEPFCRFCLAEGRGEVPATDVDHIEPKPEGSDEHENLRSLCHSCHSRRTGNDPRTRAYAKAARGAT